jgi:hypothetical protein
VPTVTPTSDWGRSGGGSPYASLSSWDDVEDSYDGGGEAATRAPAPSAAAVQLATQQQQASSSPGRAAGGPSDELRRMAQEQLRTLAGVADRVAVLQEQQQGSSGVRGSNPAANATSSLRASVYVRRASSMLSGGGGGGAWSSSPSSGGGELVLERVATWPPQSSGAAAGLGGGGGGGGDGGAEVLMLRGSDWAGGGGGSNGNGGNLAPEASLVQEEVIELPTSNTLVFPLAERGFLVGLLVAERPPQADATTTGGAASSTVLWALRAFAPALASACALDLSGALAAAQAAARQSAARGLLAEARRPLRALRTLGGMLYGSSSSGGGGSSESGDNGSANNGGGDGLPTSLDFDADMAAGVVAQSQRLADVIAALDVALHPSSPPAAVAAAASIGMGAQLLGGGGTGGAAALLSSGGGGGGAALLPSPASLQQDDDAALPPPSMALRAGSIEPAVVRTDDTEGSAAGADNGGGDGAAIATIDVSLSPSPPSPPPAAAEDAAAPPPSACCEDVADALSGALQWLSGAARAQGVALIATGPLRGSVSSSGGPPQQQQQQQQQQQHLLLRAGVSATAVAKAIGGVLTVALRSTPAGGQIQIGARAASGGGVEISVVHSGDADAERLYHAQAPPPSQQQQQQQQQRPSAEPLVSLEGVDRALRRVGGRAVVTPRFDFVSARTGKLVSGTRIEVLFPPPPPPPSAAA